MRYKVVILTIVLSYYACHAAINSKYDLLANIGSEYPEVNVRGMGECSNELYIFFDSPSYYRSHVKNVEIAENKVIFKNLNPMFLYGYEKIPNVMKLVCPNGEESCDQIDKSVAFFIFFEKDTCFVGIVKDRGINATFHSLPIDNGIDEAATNFLNQRSDCIIGIPFSNCETNKDESLKFLYFGEFLHTEAECDQHKKDEEIVECKKFAKEHNIEQLKNIQKKDYLAIPRGNSTLLASNLIPKDLQMQPNDERFYKYKFAVCLKNVYLFVNDDYIPWISLGLHPKWLNFRYSGMNYDRFAEQTVLKWSEMFQKNNVLPEQIETTSTKATQTKIKTTKKIEKIIKGMSTETIILIVVAALVLYVICLIAFCKYRSSAPKAAEGRRHKHKKHTMPTSTPVFIKLTTHGTKVSLGRGKPPENLTEASSKPPGTKDSSMMPSSAQSSSPDSSLKSTSLSTSVISNSKATIIKKANLI